MKTINEFLESIEAMRKIKVIFHCVKCRQRIETWWEKNELQGDFIARDAWWSEVLELPVVDPQGILCMSCVTNSRKRK